jgi:Predicted transcriptional regulators
VEEVNLEYMGPLLKEARLKAKLTQDEVSDRVDISTRYLMAIENEGKCPALDVWFRLIRTLHTSADDIYCLSLSFSAAIIAISSWDKTKSNTSRF